MLKERVLEVFEFTKNESPYRKANKGWINQDIFLDLSPYTEKFKQKNEDAKITLFWSPINTLLSKLFIIIILGSIIVFTSVSFSKGRFAINLLNNSQIIDNEKVELNEDINIIELSEIELMNTPLKENIDTKDLVNKNEIDDDLIKLNHQRIDEKDSFKKESKSNKEIKILQNKKLKSNFI